eukprot:CAMPEP_0206038746 /NCGR_PEP_ID=MMETSP1466-20131121/4314_1 /ASSEMBLY_ACC=CAM_ASM_001126 /TAXON_ID=44452 /ORGANISM="Pavlova gyrans, Strain CCMP608" /LENGTH=60 /DNA_ID=CAMNT_0053413351 /DNA_START=542 /DNA_END=721 /DNA_ORIENTATION=+
MALYVKKRKARNGELSSSFIRTSRENSSPSYMRIMGVIPRIGMAGCCTLDVGTVSVGARA